MARLTLASGDDRSDAAAFAGRVARWDPAAAVRLVAEQGRVALWAATPFEVLATRAVDGTVDPSPVTVPANDLLAGLAVSTAEVVDPGRSIETSWRSRLPPADGWVEIDQVPVDQITDLVRSGTDEARRFDRASPDGHGSRSRPASVPAALLDSPVLSCDGAGIQVSIPLRVLFALSGMGFAGDGSGEVVRIRATRTWLRVDARYGAVVRRRITSLPLLV